MAELEKTLRKQNYFFCLCTTSNKSPWFSISCWGPGNSRGRALNAFLRLFHFRWHWSTAKIAPKKAQDHLTFLRLPVAAVSSTPHFNTIFRGEAFSTICCSNIWGSALLAFSPASLGRWGEISGEIVELRLEQDNLHPSGAFQCFPGSLLQAFEVCDFRRWGIGRNYSLSLFLAHTHCHSPTVVVIKCGLWIYPCKAGIYQ